MDGVAVVDLLYDLAVIHRIQGWLPRGMARHRHVKWDSGRREAQEMGGACGLLALRHEQQFQALPAAGDGLWRTIWEDELPPLIAAWRPQGAAKGQLGALQDLAGAVATRSKEHRQGGPDRDDRAGDIKRDKQPRSIVARAAIQVETEPGDGKGRDLLIRKVVDGGLGGCKATMIIVGYGEGGQAALLVADGVRGGAIQVRPEVICRGISGLPFDQAEPFEVAARPRLLIV